MKLRYLILLCLAIVAVAQVAPGFTKLGSTAAGTTTFTDSTCPLLSACGYQVTAVDSTGLESAPAACSTTQLCLGGNIAVVIMPSSGTHTVTLAWTASPTTGVTYNIYRHIGPLPGGNVSATVN